jgi:uncharacterized protein YegL
MKGNAIEAVKSGVKNVMSKLAQDPFTLDIVWASVIAFDTCPRQILPLSPIHRAIGFPVAVGGASNLGKALVFLKNRIHEEVRRQTETQRGDWKPLALLMTDGWPTDDWEPWAKWARSHINLISCGMGGHVGVDNLKKLSKYVIQTSDLSSETFHQLVDFLTSTLATASQRSTGKSDSLTLESPEYSKIVLA